MTTQLTDDEVIRQRNDLEMMRRPHLWSDRFLYLKKPHPDGISQYQFALLSEKEDLWAFIPLREGLPDLANKQIGTDEFLSQLVKEGWLVD